MKKNIFFVIFILITWNSYSQVINLEIRNIQTFEHPMMKTNQAIRDNKISYLESGKTETSLVFDLDKMKLFRNMDGLYGEFDIVDKTIDESIFNVLVKFTNGQYANYILQSENNIKTLICRWTENDKVVGWFDRTL